MVAARCAAYMAASVPVTTISETVAAGSPSHLSLESPYDSRLVTLGVVGQRFRVRLNFPRKPNTVYPVCLRIVLRY